MSQAASPETRPCPECGGQREVFPGIAPEIVGYGLDATKHWGAATKNRTTYLTVRCTTCGYVAFFMKDTPPTQK